VAGADLFEQLASASAQRGWRIHVLGGADGVGDRAISILTERYPGAQVTADPGPIITDPTDVADAVLDDIARRDPDVLCVALGNPKQEYFIAAHRERMGCPVMIGVGGSMDMLVGDRHRAPRWIQAVGAEWIFRAAQEPRRLLPRYLADLRAVVPSVVRQRRKIRRYESTGSDLQVSIGADGIVASAVSADRDIAPADSTPGSTTDVVRLRLPVCIDLSGCHALSPQGHAMFWSLVRSANRYGLPVRIAGWSEELAACFDRYLTKGWASDLLAKSAGIQRHDEEKTSGFDTEFALRPIEKK
jgi:N-acetylglucosaminyldiphosphoundecaprenol N-acetyl-beta-D-mannosaminyltransferase